MSVPTEYLPPQWRFISLSEALDRIEAGKSPKADDRPALSNEVGVLKVSAVTWNRFRAQENKVLLPGYDPGDCPRVMRGDLLISRANTTELVGAVVLVTDDHPNLILSDKTLRLVPNTSVALPNYLLYALRTPEVRTYLESRATGTSGSMRNVSQQNLKSAQIPLPPLPVQRRIAAILDKADAIRRKREEGIRLTEELLRSTFLDMFGDPVSNPKGWPQQALRNLLSSIENGWSPKCYDRPVEDGEWGVLKLGAVTYCKYQPDENKALPMNERPRPEIEVKAGDLLLTRKNTYDLVAACTYVFETPPRLMLPDLIFRLRISAQGSVLPEYLWGLLTHTGKRKGIQTLAGGSAGSMPNISKEKLLGHPIEIPPINLQRQFATIIHRLHQLNIARQVQHVEHERLSSALVQRAFRGEL